MLTESRCPGLEFDPPGIAAEELQSLVNLCLYCYALLSGLQVQETL